MTRRDLSRRDVTDWLQGYRERGGQKRDEKNRCPPSPDEGVEEEGYQRLQLTEVGRRRIRNLLRLRARDGGREAVVPWMVYAWALLVRKRILLQLEIHHQEHWAGDYQLDTRVVNLE